MSEFISDPVEVTSTEHACTDPKIQSGLEKDQIIPDVSNYGEIISSVIRLPDGTWTIKPKYVSLPTTLLTDDDLEFLEVPEDRWEKLR